MVYSVPVAGILPGIIWDGVLQIEYRTFRPTDQGEVKREERLGGVIAWYYRAAA